MDTKLLDQILNAAREAATGSEAMRIEDLQRDCETWIAEDPQLQWEKARDFDALQAHIAAQPFDVPEYDTDGECAVVNLTDCTFQNWLAELERLAQ